MIELQLPLTCSMEHVLYIAWFIALLTVVYLYIVVLHIYVVYRHTYRTTLS